MLQQTAPGQAAMAVSHQVRSGPSGRGPAAWRRGAAPGPGPAAGWPHGSALRPPRLCVSALRITSQVRAPGPEVS